MAKLYTKARISTGDHRSMIEEMADLSESEIAEIMASMSDSETERLLYDWHAWARPKQRIPEGDWSTWLNMSGRGAGKTRTGAETVREWVENAEGVKLHIALVAETAADARDVIVEGISGLMAISPPWNYPKYEPALRRITWPNGCRGTLYAGEVPGQLRGPQHHKAWADEVAKWRYAEEAWDNLQYGLRLGFNPQTVVTTTPRPIQIIKDLIADPDTVVTTESSYENISNLAPKFIKTVIKKYEGTRQGEQELHAKVLSAAAGALWNEKMLDKHRVSRRPVEFKRILVSIDPSVTTDDDEGTPNEAGIMVGALGMDDDAYLLQDASDVLSPGEWARRCVQLYRAWNADNIVGERNQGGEMVRLTIQSADANVPVLLVWAAKGKAARGEPISSFAQQGRIHHVGNFSDLETQLMNVMPNGKYLGRGSPDRYDAYVWLMTALLGTESGASDDPDDYEDTRAE